MAKERVTLKEIADRLGVSVPTVSRALKGYPDISKETRAAVLKLVDELRYIPNTLALSLRKNKSNIIGVIIPEVVHHFFSSVVNGIMNYAESQGYSVLLTQSGELMEHEIAHSRLLFSAHVDGLLVALSNETNKCDHFDRYREFEIPVVLFDKVSDAFQSSQVVVNDHRGAYLATEHLIHQGCKKIVHLSGPQIPKNAIDRFEGYRDALKSYQIPFDPALVKACKMVTRKEGYDYMDKLIREGVVFDGVFGVADIVAVGALEACLDHKLKVPQEVALIGFSDSEISVITRPKLSTIYQPGYEIGRRAAEQVIHEIKCVENDKPYEYSRIELETSLRIRESSNRVITQMS